MLALEPAIVTRLRGELPGTWTVKGVFTDSGKRDPVLLVSVLFVDANVPASDVPGALVRPFWAITLMAKRGDPEALVHLDSAFALVVEALQGWTPGQVAGRRWERLQLVSVKPPPYPDDGFVGIELIFSTSARFDGQP
ncbi:hypothetical protein M2282_003267 [Variovorax boronicumulans]|uniref:hypothetical protein n=1 Tax=Variovorax boronicumulans TaxID=436515 RepID=UPI0024732A1B|nr:hypothetical protein [Variovorax boronicumulans]MDH6168116.1 hypothetical protein [Variovorax boronicumulans]